MSPRHDRGPAGPRHPQPAGRLDLRALDVPSGGASASVAPVPIQPITLAGQVYTAHPDAPELRLDAVRAAAAWHLRLRGALELRGPCWRCLEDARVPVRMDATEIHEEGSDDPEMRSLYVDHGILDLSAWARDAAVEAMPPAVLCREDCAGLCGTCGADLNAGPCGCAPAPDPRWGALADLAERLRDTDPEP
ncbi:MAG: DUF177 domain-containing protein [Thermoleophilia bacterium]